MSDLAAAMRGRSARSGALTIAILVIGAVLWTVRPLWHGIALQLWVAPIVWLPSLVVLIIGFVVYRRSKRWRTLEDLQSPRRPPPWLLAFPIGALLLLVFGSALNGTLIARSLAVNTRFEEIPSLPAGGQVRLVPREVAEQTASSAFNSPTETLTDFHIVNTPEGLRWTALRTPQGAFRVFNRKSQGLVELDATQTARSLRQVDTEFETAPGLLITDNLRWRLLKRRFLSELAEPIALETSRGPRIIVPYINRTGLIVRRPVLGGVFVVAPNGTIEDLSPEEAARRPEIASSGRLYPDTLAREVQDSYAYRGGIWNAWFVHENQTQITDTEVNRQPYLIDFRGSLGTQWVTVAEPYGRASAASAIFLTDTRTGRVRVWRVPRGRSLSGNRRALQSVAAVSIPGIDFGAGTGGTGNFRVVEPRPVFSNGKLVYLTSIIPVTANAVSKTVVIDAESNRLVQVFDNDRDPQAEAQIQRYLATGALPGQNAPDTAGEEPGAGSQAPPPASGTGGGEPDVADRLDGLLERQRDLLRDTQDLRDALRRERGG